MNRIDELFARKKADILNIYFTAGFPQLDDTSKILKALEANGADMIELGMPFSDPLADGPVIQQSSKQSLDNGMSLKVLFQQLKDVRQDFHLPLILFGYLNPVMQYGLEAFLQSCKEVGVDGLILPDLPLPEFEQDYQELFKKYGIHFIFLVTPETSDERIRKIDSLSKGFLYAVSSSSTTGSNKNIAQQQFYFERLKNLNLQNPVLVGFGIKDHATFKAACQSTRGAIIGTAFVKALQEGAEVTKTTKDFLQSVLNEPA